MDVEDQDGVVAVDGEQAAEQVNRAVSEVCARVRRQAARMYAGLPPDEEEQHPTVLP
ncbi:hypothetical protein [Streptomyces sp. NPDC050856]|uniref:hypothetical protein n=1 Tax=Streptomyces sp. NPDC050856 TaxID=3154939 RepID=UPI00340380AB